MFLMLLLYAMAVLALLPAALFCLNLWLFRVPRKLTAGGAPLPRVSVLIPARNEEQNLPECLRCVQASTGVALEILVLDDHSTDGTAALVERVAEQDARVRLVRSAALPEGWNGKQHACWQLAQAAAAERMLFLDADVRLQPEAVARCLAEQRRSGVALLSGFPHLVTGTALEWLLLPLIHFVLLGFLPIAAMRRGANPAFAAGCGQFMVAEREAYFAAGGHRALRESRHDGLRLPLAFRRAGFRSDIVDLTPLASVRMYTSAAETWSGLAKNATEGLGHPARIVLFTVMLALGQILPALCALLILVGITVYEPLGAGLGAGPLHMPQARADRMALLVLVALFASYLPRVLASWRFRQSWRSALLHPLGVAVLLVLQWYALLRKLAGKPVAWRAREYASKGLPGTNGGA